MAVPLAKHRAHDAYVAVDEDDFEYAAADGYTYRGQARGFV